MHPDRAIEAEAERGQERDRAIEAERATGQQRDRAIEAEGKTNDALGKLRLAVAQQEEDQYLWDMQLVPVALNAGRSDEARRLLARHIPQAGKPDRRAVEWYFWNRQLEPGSAATLEKAPGRGQWTVSEDGSRLAHLTDDYNSPPVLSVWDVKTRNVVLQTTLVNTAKHNVYGPWLSRDGKRVAVIWSDSTDVNNTTSAWRAIDVGTGRTLFEQTGVPMRTTFLSSDRDSCAFSPDGRWLEVFYRVAPEKFGVVDLGKEGEPARPKPAGAADVVLLKKGTRRECPISPDGSWVAYYSDGRVTVRDLATGKERGWAVPEAKSCALVLSPDGRLLAGATSDAAPGLPVIDLRPPEERPAAPRGNRWLRVWESATGKELYSVPLMSAWPGQALSELYFSPNGERLAVAYLAPNDPDKVLDLTVWDPRTGRQFPPPQGMRGPEVFPNEFAYFLKLLPKFSPDGRLLVFVRGRDVSTWDTTTGKLHRTFHGHANNVEECFVTADGARCLSVEATGAFREWDLGAEARAVVRLDGGGDFWGQLPRISEDGGLIAALTPQPGEHLVPGVAAKLGVQLWDAATGKARKLLIPPRDPGTKEVPSPEFTPQSLSGNNRRVALARGQFPAGRQPDTPLPDGDLTVWDAESGDVLLHQKMDGPAAPLPFLSADGSTAVALRAGRIVKGAAGAIRVFDVATGRERASLPLPEAIEATTFSQSGIALSPDGRYLAACLTTNLLELMMGRPRPGDPPRPKPIRKLFVWELDREGPPGMYDFKFPPMPRLVWSRDGKRLAVTVSPPSPESGPVRMTMGGFGATPDIAIIDPSTGKVHATTEQPLLEDGRMSFMLTNLALSPDGRRVAARFQTGRIGGSWTGVEHSQLRVWDADTGKLMLTHPIANSAGMSQLTFSPDGHRLLFEDVVQSRPAAPPEKPEAGRVVWDLKVMTLGEDLAEEAAK